MLWTQCCSHWFPWLRWSCLQIQGAICRWIMEFLGRRPALGRWGSQLLRSTVSGLGGKKKNLLAADIWSRGLIAKSDWMEKALAEKYHCWCFTNISIAKAAGRKCFGLKMSVHQTVSYSSCFTDRTRLQKWVTAHPDNSDQRCPYYSVLVCNPSWYYRTAAASRGSKWAVVLL